MRLLPVGVASVLAGLMTTSAAHAQNAGIAFFEAKVRPILVAHCYECHAINAKKIRGKLLLDSRAGLLKGGVSGPALAPGDPDKSLLIQAIRFHPDGMKMPPKGKLPGNVIADLEAWVKMGAPDPRDKVAASKVAESWEETVRIRQAWWSLQPVRNPAVPVPKDAGWSQYPIDRFLLAKLEAMGLTPAGDADPHTLIRRLSLVLTGLPPTPNEVERFVKARATSGVQPSVEALVDRLLASPHFGERWARHWMDVVRFTETHGNEWNYDVHHAWRYRDYLIRAFNDDVPYDQLVREQIAGDLLPNPRWNSKERFNESILGTAFYRFGEVNHDDCIDLRSIGYDLADNQIDTLTKAFQATTVACARCHDHKLDAVSQRDYYSLLGVLRGSRQVAHTIDAPDVNAETLRKMGATKNAIRRELAQVWRQPIDAALLDKVLSAADAKLPPDDPLAWLRSVIALEKKENLRLADAWTKVAQRLAQEEAESAKFNAQHFTTSADFRQGVWPNWQMDGQGLRGTPARSGDFTISREGDCILAAVLPAGAHTHALSEKLNGSLRSPLLTARKKFISFQVLGDRASAVRLVSNNCQLNYRNFRYLTTDQLHWVTFPVPEDAEGLRVYAEIMTKFDNPKFPDQLGTLGGGKTNDRVPWEQAAADPRSYFGITQVVLHDQPTPPKATLTHLRGLFAGPPPTSPADLAIRFTRPLESAIRAFGDDQATDDDVRWLDAFLRSGLLSNRANRSPRLEKLLAEYRRLDATLMLPRIAPGLADAGAGFDQPVFARGDCLKPGARAPRGYVAALSPVPFAAVGSGRLELAHAIASRENPLTARVMVNRVWHHLFGAGLVRSVDDFGHVGELPSHPELLDYLAHRFVAEGWSMKRLIRAIVLTRTFQRSHQPSAAALEADPNNRLLSYYPARRMEAETIRDALLATSGRLDRTLFGLSISAYRDKEYADRRLFQGPLDGNGRRSIYIKVTLMEPPKFLEVFNFPGGKVCQGRRDVTSTPAQALAMLNDPFVHGQADVWARRLLERKHDTLASRIDVMFRSALGRAPRPEEHDRFARFVSQVAKLNSVPPDRVLASAAVWRDVGHAIFNVQEFITVP